MDTDPAFSALVTNSGYSLQLLSLFDSFVFINILCLAEADRCSR